jgi:hypothetical protein
MNPTKWRVSYSDANIRTQNTPSQNVWYNPGSESYQFPIGAWQIAVTGTDICVTKSTEDYLAAWLALNTVADGSGTSYVSIYTWDPAVLQSYAMIQDRLGAMLVLAAKTTAYMIMKTNVTGATSIYSNARAFFLECAYL